MFCYWNFHSQPARSALSLVRQRQSIKNRVQKSWQIGCMKSFEDQSWGFVWKTTSPLVQLMVVRWLRLRQAQGSWAMLIFLPVSLPPCGKIYRSWVGLSESRGNTNQITKPRYSRKKSSKSYYVKSGWKASRVIFRRNEFSPLTQRLKTLTEKTEMQPFNLVFHKGKQAFNLA